MSDYIWSKGDGGGPDAEIMRFLAGNDVRLDRVLLPFDIRASRAHARGLARIGVIGEDEARRLVAALDALQDEVAAGEFELDARFEDAHSAIEAWLTERLGPLGGKIHAGRSRNDQVAVAVRLYLKARLARLADACLDIAGAAIGRAGSEADVPMPGYTHLQRAMPSSLGLWWAGHAEAFMDNAELALNTRDWLDACPLGAASGFGVNLPLAREWVARELGFQRLVINPQAAQNARGKVELRALDALGAATGDLRRLTWDLSLFTCEEFGFARLPDRYCTGSSIMPNKRNPDTVELLRAVHPMVVGAHAELDAVLALPSGYQRDLQNTKSPVLRALDGGLEALGLVPDLLEAVEWVESRLHAAISPAMHATDLANEQLAGGRSFREAYRAAAEAGPELAGRRPEDSLAARVSPGAAGCLMLDELAARRGALAARAASLRGDFQQGG